LKFGMFDPPGGQQPCRENPLAFTDSSCRLHRETGKIIRDCIRKIGTLTLHWPLSLVTLLTLPERSGVIQN
jgi:hypothetical protein